MSTYFYRLIFLAVVLSIVFLFPEVSPTLMARGLDKTITQYSVHIWNMKSGLPGNSIYAVRQTQDGHLWIGTGGGLVRFDGFQFELYDREKIKQLKSDEIRTLYEDRHGTLWIGTFTGGLTRYRGGEFKTFPITKYKTLQRISTISEDRWGNLWIGSFQEGLTCITGISSGKLQFKTYSTDRGLPGNQVRFIYKDKNEDLWVTTEAGIVRLLKPGIFQNYASQEVLPYLKTACLYKEETKELWIGTFGGGLFRSKNAAFSAFGIETGVPHQNINCLYRDRMKNLWIGSDGEGLSLMRNRKLSTLAGDEDLACDYVYSIYEDREGSIWIGTLDGGLLQLNDNKFTTYTTREGLAHDYIYCIYEDRAGNLWIGTQGGLSRLNWKNRELTTVLTTRQKLLDNTITCILEDPAGYLWIGTSGGLHLFKDGKLSTFTKRDGLSDNKILCLFKDKQGNTWIGTENGLNRFNINNKKFTFFTKKEGLLSNNIDVIYEDSKGRLWIGTDVGLNWFSYGEISIYNPKGMLENSHILCILEDNQGVLWFGTDNGLICLRDNETLLYNIQSGLIENYVNFILEDEIGYLWLGGRHGISRIRKKELEDFSRGKMGKIRQVHPESYNEKDGMKSRWCTGIGCKTHDGRLWFPTSQGVTMIDPNHIKTNQLPPPVKIEKIIVDGQSIYFHETEGGKISTKLGPGKKRLEFYYTSMSFINPQKIRFKIRMKGYDSDWIDMGTARSTIYTGLPAGDYIFNVVACNSDGVWNREGASLYFYLQPHFYETTWFYFLVALFVLLAVFFLHRLRIRQLKAREKELSALVEVRTRDLKARTNELESAHHKLRQSKEIIEEKNRHIMDSFHYAHKIQHTMLPIKEKLKKELKDHFVIYKPKDIVSGDFYWFDVIEGQYFLAVADCTGHGVPGALLSMIGCMMLNEVLHARHILDPAKILARLHQGFRYVLKQGIEETDTYDGMDIGLCRVDLPAGKITYAGARRPLFYAANSEFIEIKGDRKSIGGRQKEIKHTFTNHEIDIPDKNQDGIVIYLTTDGFADQHNPGNRKYGSRHFKQFLRSIASLPMAQQKEALLKELDRHQANEEQRDDITIIGIRVK